MQFLPEWVCCQKVLFKEIFFVKKLLTVLFTFIRVMEHIGTSRKNIEKEVRDLLKLCRWERSMSVETLRRMRQKLRKLVQKYTVSEVRTYFVMLFAIDNMNGAGPSIYSCRTCCNNPQCSSSPEEQHKREWNLSHQEVWRLPKKAWMHLFKCWTLS